MSSGRVSLLIGCLLLGLPVACVSRSDYGGVTEEGRDALIWKQCQDEGEYSIRVEFLLIEEDKMTRELLSATFDRLHRSKNVTELYVIASPDRGLYERGTQGETGWSDSPKPEMGASVTLPFRTNGPIAQLYSMGRNAFFELRDAGGQYTQEVLEGLEVFSFVSKSKAVFVGQGFLFHEAFNWSCRDGSHRWISWVVEDWTDENLRAIAERCNKFFEVPDALHLIFYRTMEEAGRCKGIAFPSLTAVARGYIEEPTDGCDEMVFYTRAREVRRITSRSWTWLPEGKRSCEESSEPWFPK